MQLKDLREFISQIPAKFDEYELVNGEYTLLDPDDPNSLAYRLDKPIIVMVVDEQTKEVCMLHQTEEEMSNILNKNDEGTT